jgi:hypothetical protein
MAAAAAVATTADDDDGEDTINSMNNLAAVYTAQGRNAEAAAMLESCLENQKRVLGPDHQDTLTSKDNLAKMYNAQSGYAAPHVGASCTVQGTSRPELNGSKGKVISFDFNKSRYTVQLPDGRCLALRPSNVELLTGGKATESSTTPVDGTAGVDAASAAAAPSAATALSAATAFAAFAAAPEAFAASAAAASAVALTRPRTPCVLYNVSCTQCPVSCVLFAVCSVLRAVCCVLCAFCVLCSCVLWVVLFVVVCFVMF